MTMNETRTDPWQVVAGRDSGTIRRFGYWRRVLAPDASLRCLVASADELGEGPCWSAVDGRLYWFDIKSSRLAWFEPSSGAAGGWTLPVRASAGAPREGGGLIVATEAGLGRVNTRTGGFELVEAVRLPYGHRSNEGGVDATGRFWWSEMDDAAQAPGGVYVTLPGKRSRRVLDGVTIPNTLTSSADGLRLYVADSATQAMAVYAVGDKGDLTDPKPFITLEGQSGVPDGSALDADGFLWNAQWGAWRVVRYSPAGEIDRIVEMPVEQPTSCAFGGPDLRTLFITSARSGLSDRALADQTLAGGLFAIEPGVAGQPLPLFAG